MLPITTSVTPYRAWRARPRKVLKGEDAVEFEACVLREMFLPDLFDSLNISHDLKTQITTVKRYVEGIIDGNLSSGDRRRKNLLYVFKPTSPLGAALIAAVEKVVSIASDCGIVYQMIVSDGGRSCI